MSLNDVVINNEPSIRLAFFFGVFACMAAWEILSPRRVLTVSKPRRWANNLSIVVINTLLLRLLFPTAAVGVALFAGQLGWGVLNHITLSYWLTIVLSVIVLDLAIYLQHVMFHAVPVLWRLHRMHHADLDFDVTTGTRFHPIEIILSMLIKFAVILIVGPPVVGVVIFEVLLNATSMFNHGNVRIPESVDRALRWLVVTPDMHRVHHSSEYDETNSNFGFNLPWWDRLLGTYKAQPRAGHNEMVLGIETFRDEKTCDSLGGMLAIPFIGRQSDYPINRRSQSSDENQ